MAMETSPSIGAIAKALSSVQGEIKGALKDSDNPFFKSRYADLASVWDACREPLHKHGLAVFQTISGDTTGVIVTTMLAHISGEWVRDACRTEPKDMSPQSVGSATTYLRRYGLAAIVGVVQVDDDAESSQPRGTAPIRRAPLPGKSSPRLDSEMPSGAEDSKSPPENWWLEPIDNAGNKALTWQKCAEENQDWLLRIVEVAVKEKGKPTEEDDHGWTMREMSAFHALRRFNPGALSAAKQKAPARPAAASKAPAAEITSNWEPDAPQASQEALPAEAYPWAEGWHMAWCMVGPEPELTWQQLVSAQADFVRDLLRKTRLSHGADHTKWPLPAQKALRAVQQWNPVLLKK